MTKISIHPLFFFVVLLAFLHGFIYDVLLLFAIVLIHECGHAAVAYSFRWRIKKIELLPFGGAAEVEEHGNKPMKEEALVILAGPLMNVIMIVISWFFLQLKVWSADFALTFIEYNLIILIFNLLPIWPLDGGKLVQLFLCLLFPYKRAIQYSLLSSLVALILYIFIVAFYLPVYFYLWSVAVFLIVSLFLEYRQSPYQYVRFLMSRYQGGTGRSSDQTLAINSRWSSIDVPQTVIIYPHNTIKQIIERLFRQKTHYFCLIDQRGALIHMFKEDELLHYYFDKKWIHRAVADILR